MYDENESGNDQDEDFIDIDTHNADQREMYEDKTDVNRQI